MFYYKEARGSAVYYFRIPWTNKHGEAVGMAYAYTRRRITVPRLRHVVIPESAHKFDMDQYKLQEEKREVVVRQIDEYEAGSGKCFQCRYFRQHAGKNTGDCQRYPPQPGNTVQTRFDDSCGEWTARAGL